MPKKMFAIVGYTNWGKSNTLYELFGRKQFQPLYSPITSPIFISKKFVVINASNEDRPTSKYLDRLQKILDKQKQTDITFMITISLYFNDGPHDAKAVFAYLQSLDDFDITFIVLKNGWYKGASLITADIEEMTNGIRNSKIIYFDNAINQSKSAFTERTFSIASLLK